MEIMDTPVDAIRAGKKVFVNLGHSTVKCGLVFGYRVTIVPTVASVGNGMAIVSALPVPKVTIEYLIKWLDCRDRKEQQEWFPSERVQKTPNQAFQL